MRPIDYTAVRHGQLVGLSRVANDSHDHAVWLWQCDCGSTKAVMADNVRRGRVVSCGCVQQENRTRHGMHQTRTYMAWQNMKARVLGRTDRSAKSYSDRGIQVCARWADSFDTFFADMGECPSGMTLERADNDGNYEPGNCRWATHKEQMANTRRTHRVTINGRAMCLAEACRELGLVYSSIMKRMGRGLSAQSAIEVST